MLSYSKLFCQMSTQMSLYCPASCIFKRQSLSAYLHYFICLVPFTSFSYIFSFSRNQIEFCTRDAFTAPDIKHSHTNLFRLYLTLLFRIYKKSNRIYFVNVAIIHSLQFGNVNLLSDNSS